MRFVVCISRLKSSSVIKPYKILPNINVQSILPQNSHPNVTRLTRRAHLLCRLGRDKPSRTGLIRRRKQTYVMKWKHSHCTPNPAEPNRTEPVHWLMFVLLTSRRPILFRNMSNFLELKCVCFFYNDCKYIGLRRFNQCGAFKTDFVGTK